jgi:hypothetical protein
MLAQAGVPALQQRQQLVADAVAGEGEMAIGRVLAPGLADFVEVGLDFGAGGGQQRAQDGAFRAFEPLG